MTAAQYKFNTFTATGAGTEDTVTANPETTAGVYTFVVDMAALVNGDILTVKVKEKATGSGDTQRVIWERTYANIQGEPLAVSPALILLHGWDLSFTMPGTGRSLKWSIRTP